MSAQEGDTSPDTTRHVRHTPPPVAIPPGSPAVSRRNDEAAPATPHGGPPTTTVGPQGGRSGGPGEPTSHIQPRSSYSVGSERDLAPGRAPSGRSDKNEWLRHRAVPLDGTRLRQARWRQGLTQADCARAAGLSATHLSALERGRATTPKTLRRLAEVLNCSPSDLLPRDVGS